MNCDRIAPYYRALEYATFGKNLESCRCAFLEEVKNCRRALLCGDGDGRFLQALLLVNPGVDVDSVDLSRGMLEIARQRVEAMGRADSTRVRFHAEDVRTFCPPEKTYDLIVTHFFLDCFSDQDASRVIERLASWAEPRAKFLVSEFHQPEGRISRAWTGAVIRALYASFWLTTGLGVTRLPDYVPALERCGFVEERRQLRLGGLLLSSLWNRGS